MSGSPPSLRNNGNGSLPKDKINIAIGYSEVIPGFYEKIWSPFKENIVSVFFSAPREFGVNNARGVYTEKDALQKLRLMRAEKPTLDVNLLLNSACIGNRLTEDEEFRVKCVLNRLYEMNCFTSITVSNCWYLKQVLKWKQQHNVNVDIHASVIWDIKTIEEVRNIFWRFGDACLQCINISRIRVHDLDFLREFRNYFPEIKIKLIVNEWCMHNCPDQTAHANYLSHWSEYSRPQKNFLATRMLEERIQFCVYDHKNFWRFLCGNGIPPDGIGYYEGLVDIWKIGSRSKNPEIMAELCDAYIHQKPKDLHFLFRTSHGGFCAATDADEEFAKKFKGVYLPESWIKKRLACDNRCYQCNFCERLFKNLLPKTIRIENHGPQQTIRNEAAGPALSRETAYGN